MIQKLSEMLNETAGIAERAIAVVDGDEKNLKKIYIIDRSSLRVIKEKDIVMFDKKFNFTSIFKSYAYKTFGSLEQFLQNAKFVRSLDDAMLMLKKEKRYLAVDNPTIEN